MRFHSLAGAVTALALSVSAGAAQPYSDPAFGPAGALCGQTDAAFDPALRDALVGTWRSLNHSGFMRTPQTGVMAFPGTTTDNVTLWTADGTLMASNENDMRDVVLKPYDATTWSIEKYPWEEMPGRAGVRVPVTLENLGLSIGCDINELPRMVGTIKVRQQGIDMVMDVYLMVMGTNQMHGIMRAQGDVVATEVDPAAPMDRSPFWMWRSFTMTRDR